MSEFELSVERHIDAAPATVYRVWTERLEEWWAPKPWTTRIVEQDLRPGGRSALIMSGPDGPTPIMEGVFLEVVQDARIVFTNALGAGWIPRTPFMVGAVHLRRRRWRHALPGRRASLGQGDPRAARGDGVHDRLGYCRGPARRPRRG